MKVLITGGVKSGKSSFAERKVLELSKVATPLYLATAELADDEMRERVARHRRQRGSRFRTVEEPLRIVESLSGDSEPALVECMTLWLNNWLHYGKPEEEISEVIKKLLVLHRDLVLVINEVGQGVIPKNPLARRFVDLSGKVSCQLGEGCDEIWFCIAGRPMRIK